MSELLAFDNSHNHPVCGIDEVGRGPLAGPVISACVYIPQDALKKSPALIEAMDSKKLTAKKRQTLHDAIKAHCYWGIGGADVAEIDRINILQATFEAMRRAAHNMISAAPDLQGHMALIDGNKIPAGLPFSDTQAIVKGDSKSLCIAAASILAKVTRDNYMADIAKEFPQYGWESNAGYGAKIHLDAIKEHGATPHHRMSFAPLKYMDQAKKTA